MFNLNDILQNAQDGKVVENLAQQFGISPDQAQAAVHALIPAISAGLMQKVQSSGLGGIASALSDSTHQAAFSSADAAQAPDAAQKGSDAVNDMFGSSHIVHQVAQQASSVTGIRPDLLTQMLPVVVSIALGGLAKSAQNQGLSGVIGRLASSVEQGGSGTSGGLMGIFSSLLGSLFGGGTATSGASQGTLENLTKMFQTGNLPPEISQSGIGEEIGKILSRKS